MASAPPADSIGGYLPMPVFPPLECSPAPSPAPSLPSIGSSLPPFTPSTISTPSPAPDSVSQSTQDAVFGGVSHARPRARRLDWQSKMDRAAMQILANHKVDMSDDNMTFTGGIWQEVCDAVVSVAGSQASVVTKDKCRSRVQTYGATYGLCGIGT